MGIDHSNPYTVLCDIITVTCVEALWNSGLYSINSHTLSREYNIVVSHDGLMYVLDMQQTIFVIMKD